MTAMESGRAKSSGAGVPNRESLNRGHRVAKFFITACVVYGVWLAAWPVTQGSYRAVFSQLGEAAIGNVGESGHVRFTSPEAKTHASDVLLILENSRHPGSQGRLPISSRTQGYLPTGFTLALILATPTPWHRRLWSVFFGAVLISIFVEVSLWLQVADKFSGPVSDSFFAYHPGAFWRFVLTVMLKILSKSPVTPYIAPAFIWLVVSFRREDVARMLVRSTNIAPTNMAAT